MRKRIQNTAMTISLRRRTAAWILLAVFVPMLVLTLGHHHQMVAENGVACVDCAHHVPHSGHLQTGSSAVDDCPFCQLSGVSYVAAPSVSIALFVQSFSVKSERPVPAVVGRELFCSVPRAPPFAV